MTIGKDLSMQVITAIAGKGAEKAWQGLSRMERVIRLLDKLGIQNLGPGSGFPDIYAHTLVEYGVDQPGELLHFFRAKEIRGAFERAFEEDNPGILQREAELFIQWHKTGKELEGWGLDPRLEFSRFTVIFNRLLRQTRTPYEVDHDNVTRRLHEDVREILKSVREGSLERVREANLEQIRGSLVERVSEWFDALGYRRESGIARGDDFWELGVGIPERRGVCRILVRCLQRMGEASDMERLEAAVREGNFKEGWLVTERSMAKGACDLGKECPDIYCYTFDQLLDQEADFSNYFAWLETQVKEREVRELYIPLACRRELFDPSGGEKTGEEFYRKEDGWITGYMDRWLEDTTREHVSILGEFGTGKTWFTLHYAYRAMLDYRRAVEKGLERPRLPVVVQLRDYAKQLSSESLFSDFFFHKHEISLPNYSAFRFLNRIGKLLLLFDGFDEMADKMDRQRMIDNFWELARVVVPGSKAVLTCRNEHFPEAREGRKLLKAELRASVSDLSAEPPRFEVLYLEPFDQEQIRLALSRRTKKETVDVIMGNGQLADMARRPVLLEYIIYSLKEIEEGKPVDLARIYLYAVTKKLREDFKTGRTFTSSADRLFFMCELSSHMLSTNVLSLNYRAFPGRLQQLFGAAVSEEKTLDFWKYSMMGNTLLVRNDDGDYSPAHKSLTEFFTAFKLAACLGFLPPDFTAAAADQSHIDRGRAPQPYSWDCYFRREADEQGEISLIAPLDGFKAGDREALLLQLARMPEAVWRFLFDMANHDAVRGSFYSFLITVLEDFKTGRRDPAKEQAVLQFIYSFRRLSREWDGGEERGREVCRIWNGFRGKEMGVAGEKPSVITIEHGNGTPSFPPFEMVRIPTGSFLMGDNLNDREGPIHRVSIAQSYLIGTTPVTNKLYKSVMGELPSRFEGDNRPLENVSWMDAVLFCNRLSEQVGLTPVYTIDGETVVPDWGSGGFRLPTEAEWEFACRAGSTDERYGDLEKIAWYSRNSGDSTHPVAALKPNAWGMYDMLGNVWEWCWDWYDRGYYKKSPLENPQGPSEGGIRVIRGGGWGDSPDYCRASFRSHAPPGLRLGLLGFRLARSFTP